MPPLPDFQKHHRPCPEHVLASRKSNFSPLCRATLGGLKTCSIGEGVGGQDAKTWAAGGGRGWLHADPVFWRVRDLRTPQSNPVQNDSLTHSRARKWLLTPAPWSPLELYDPASDLVYRPPPLQREPFTWSLCLSVLCCPNVQGEHGLSGDKWEVTFHHQKSGAIFEPRETHLMRPFLPPTF